MKLERSEFTTEVYCSLAPVKKCLWLSIYCCFRDKLKKKKWTVFTTCIFVLTELKIIIILTMGGSQSTKSSSSFLGDLH